MRLKEYNELQLKLIINKYKHFPDNEELTNWIKQYAKCFKNICDLWINDFSEIEKMLYEQNKRV